MTKVLKYIDDMTQKLAQKDKEIMKIQKDTEVMILKQFKQGILILLHNIRVRWLNVLKNTFKMVLQLLLVLPQSFS